LQWTSPIRQSSHWHEAFAHIDRGDCDASSAALREAPTGSSFPPDGVICGLFAILKG
jgi:hypothetical protein